VNDPAALSPLAADDLVLPAHVPLAVATRGGVVEAVHYGSIAVVDAGGTVLHAAGDVGARIFPRSSLKPLQALPLVAHPGFARFGFGPREIALLCASHSGEPRHAETVAQMLQTIGGHKHQLLCGTHPPLYFEAMDIRPRAEDIYAVVHHQCSGKHTGMLALAALLDLPADDYINPAHPVQQQVLEAVEYFTGVPRAQIITGIDGCSAPNFAVPLAALAAAFARLSVATPDPRYGDAPRLILEAMARHPEMVSGLKRLDLAVAHAGKGDWVPKSGAEAVHALVVRSRGLGIAIKVADGSARAVAPVVVSVLQQLGLTDSLIDTPLEGYARPPITNLRGVVTGTMVPVFELRQP
jgi:L-asparaginase II